MDLNKILEQSKHKSKDKKCSGYNKCKNKKIEIKQNIFCPKCGANITDKKNCPRCGKKVVE